MAHQVIARRYRPQGFDAVVGQEAVVRALSNALESGRLGAAFLFSGTRGVGKTTCARILAKCVNCRRLEKPGPKPCGECEACIEIAEGRALDVLEIDAASHTQVDKTRELLAGTQYAPARDRFKIIILDEVHMLSDSSFNALLKTLEEPPAHLLFILATTDPDEVPVTVRSRCLHFVFRPIAGPVLESHLKKILAAERATASDDAVARIARAARGSLRDAQSLLEQLLALGGGQVLDADARELTGGRRTEMARVYLGKLADGDAGALLDCVDAVLAAGESPEAFAGELLVAARDLLLAAARGKPVEPELAGAKEFLEGDRAALLLDLLMEQDRRCRKNPHAQAVLEAYAFRLARLKDLLPLEAFLAGGVPAAAPPAPPARGGSPSRSAPVSFSTPVPSASPAPVAEPIPTLPPPGPAPAPGLREPFLAALRALDSMAEGYVETAKVDRRGDRLLITFPPTRARSRDRMAKPESLALLLKAARQADAAIAGVEVELEGGEQGAPEPPAPVPVPPREASRPAPPGAPASSRRPVPELRNHPAVRGVMEALGAELVASKPPKASAPEPAADDDS